MKTRKLALLLVLVLSLILGSAMTYASDGDNTLTFVLHNEPDGIDPNVTSNSFASPFLSNAFEGLVRTNRENSLEPALAESWDISEDGKTYTFTLREGLKWSDGTPLTAEDFVYSIQRVLTPETAAQYVTMLTGYIAGAEAFYEGEGDADSLGVKSPDANTLVIELIEPAPFFLDILSMHVFAPVQKATIDANGDEWTLSPETYIVNGPFKVTEMNLGESVVMEKNEHYYDAENVKLQKIVFRYIKEQATALTAFEAGEIDGFREVPLADVPRLKAESDDFYSLPAYGTTYYLLNNGKAPYDDVNVRKALNLAIDRQSLIDNVLLSSDTPATGLVASGYSVDGVDYTEGRSDYGILPTAQVEEAQAALAEAGYPGGEGFPTMQLSYYTNPQVKTVVEALAQMWTDNLGIDVEISTEEWAVYYTNVQAGNYEVAAMGWGADYLHPMTFFPLFVTDESVNNTFYSNPAYDEKVAEAKKETDPAAAVTLMREAEDILMADYPAVFLYYRNTNLMMKDYVKGWYLTPTNNLVFRDAYVER
ncbi:MAG TPA: peptide ABC transporter substrate-binding protein [Clostridiaceae bacterium]|nr:peptide ABC transporter substrate-binding protein [Clostridiaceae bacterium]